MNELCIDRIAPFFTLKEKKEFDLIIKIDRTFVVAIDLTFFGNLSLRRKKKITLIGCRSTLRVHPAISQGQHLDSNQSMDQRLVRYFYDDLFEQFSLPGEF